MKHTLFVVLSLLTMSLIACTEPAAQVPAKGPGYSQGPAEARQQGARNAPFDRSVMRDHTMPATAM